SPHAAGRAFLAMYRYRMDDFRPYVYRTDDYGKSWTLLTDGSNGIPAGHFVRVVREDPERKGLLYAGTEFGMYISFDDGAHWQPFQLNLPLTPVTDLRIHQNDLVVSTQGRSIWILDDVTPLRQLSAQVASAPAHLFKPRDTYRMQMAGRSGGAGSRAGQNPPAGVLVFYTFAQAPADEVTLEILDGVGTAVVSFSSKARGRGALPAKAGMNRFAWDLRYPGGEVPEGVILRGGPPEGAMAVPGTYQVRLSTGGWSQTQAFQVLMDPRIPATVADLQAQHDLQTRTNARVKDTYDAVGRIRAFKEQLRSRAEGGDDAAKRAATALEQRLTEVEGELLNLKFRSEKDPLNFEPKLDNLLAYLSNVIGDGAGRPTVAMREEFEVLDGRLEVQLSRLRELLGRAPGGG
ncbi:MAG: hypothetical protein Q8N53_06300, partial [Longimicrobiales bacterium]|nr:hypothetical protein [Longimicrobiales bacterium]